MTERYLLGYIFTWATPVLTYVGSAAARESEVLVNPADALFKYSLVFSLILTILLTRRLAALWRQGPCPFYWTILYLGVSGIAFHSYWILLPEHLWGRVCLASGLLITLIILMVIEDRRELKMCR